MEDSVMVERKSWLGGLEAKVLVFQEAFSV